MIRQLAFLFLSFSQLACAQSVSRAREEKAYAQAIYEYLQATSKRHGSTFDTLLIGKRPDFPAVTLPSRVGNTIILFLSTKETDKKRKHNSKLIFVNLVGTVTEDRSEFIFVTFYPRYTHQYDCMIDLKYNITTHAFGLDHLTSKTTPTNSRSETEKKHKGKTLVLTIL